MFLFISFVSCLDITALAARRIFRDIPLYLEETIANSIMYDQIIQDGDTEKLKGGQKWLYEKNVGVSQVSTFNF